MMNYKMKKYCISLLFQKMRFFIINEVLDVKDFHNFSVVIEMVNLI